MIASRYRPTTGTGVNSVRARTALAVIVGCLLITGLLKIWQARSGASAGADMMLETFAGALGYGALGFLITTRAPGNRLGPLMLGLGVIAGFQGLLGQIDAGGSEFRLPGALGEWLYGVAAACQVLFVGGVVVLLLLAPTGRPLTSRWRWVIWLTVVSVLSAALDALIFRADQEAGIEPTGVAAVASGLLTGLGSFVMLGLLAAPLCLGLRWYRAKGLERQQVLWVAAGGLAGPLLIVIAAQLPAWALRPINSLDGVLHGSLLWSMAAVALPAGTTVAVLRHRLYDIDKVISRTTSYAVVTGVVVAVYVGIVAAATSVFQLPNQISVAVATLTAAAVFRPVLVRAQAVIDRRFNRSRYDAEQTVRAFAHRLRDEVDPDIVAGDLLAALNRTMQPSVVSLWMRDG